MKKIYKYLIIILLMMLSFSVRVKANDNLEVVCEYEYENDSEKWIKIYYNKLEDNFYFKSSAFSEDDDPIPLEDRWKYNSVESVYVMQGYNSMYDEVMDQLNNFTCPNIYQYTYDDEIAWNPLSIIYQKDVLLEATKENVITALLSLFMVAGAIVDDIIGKYDNIELLKALLHSQSEWEERHLEKLQEIFGASSKDEIFFGYYALTSQTKGFTYSPPLIEEKTYEFTMLEMMVKGKVQKNNLEKVLKNKKDEYNYDCDNFKNKIVSEYGDINERDIKEICIFKRSFPKKLDNGEFRHAVVSVNLGASANRLFEYRTIPDKDNNKIDAYFKEIESDSWDESLTISNSWICGSGDSLFYDDSKYSILEKNRIGGFDILFEVMMSFYGDIKGSEELKENLNYKPKDFSKSVGYFNVCSEEGINYGKELEKLTCEEILGSDFVKEINSYLLYVKVAVPIIIIVMGSIDFGSAFISSDEEKMKKAQKRFIQRLIIGIVIFFIPVFVKILLNISSEIWSIGNDTCNIKF